MFYNTFKNIIILAFHDYCYEWRMSSCFVLALSAVLAPMLILFGLKYGIVSNMVTQLVEDPRNREIRPVGSGYYPTQWFTTTRNNAAVAFVVPRTRTLAANMKLYRPQAGRIVTVELLPSGAGDPLLQDGPFPSGLRQVVLAHTLANKLQIKVGDTVEGSVGRINKGKRERATLTLTVTAIAKPGAFKRDGVFVTPLLLTAVEDFRDGYGVKLLKWDGNERNEEQRYYSGYRMYARSIDDVAKLAQQLRKAGDVRTKAAAIAVVQSLKSNLSILFWITAVVALLGFSLSLGASLWANVDRKQRELSVLRLIGVNSAGIIWFPIWQGLFTGCLGILLASTAFLGAAHGINQLFAQPGNGGQNICQLLPHHFIIASVITLMTALIASALGGYRAAQIEPSEGLREV